MLKLISSTYEWLISPYMSLNYFVRNSTLQNPYKKL